MKVVKIRHADMIFECIEELAGGIAPSNKTEYRVKSSFRALPSYFGTYCLTVAKQNHACGEAQGYTESVVSQVFALLCI